MPDLGGTTTGRSMTICVVETRNFTGHDRRRCLERVPAPEWQRMDCSLPVGRTRVR